MAEEIQKTEDHLSMKWDMKELDYYEKLSSEKKEVFLIVRNNGLKIETEMQLAMTDRERSEEEKQERNVRLKLLTLPQEKMDDFIEFHSLICDHYLKTTFKQNRRLTNILYKLKKGNPNILMYYQDLNRDLRIWEQTQDLMFSFKYYRTWQLPKYYRSLYFFIKEIVGMGLIIKNLKGEESY